MADAFVSVLGPGVAEPVVLQPTIHVEIKGEIKPDEGLTAEQAVSAWIDDYLSGGKVRTVVQRDPRVGETNVRFYRALKPI